MAKLSFRYGAMNAGKSTALLQIAFNYSEKNKKTLIIKPKIDTKGCKKVVSRIGIEKEVDILLDSEESLYDDNYLKQIKSVDCLLVDECQFLTGKQIEELFKIAKELDITVICFGIRTNFQSHLFEGSKRLMELADEFEELITICSCGKKAKFNARKVDGKFVTKGNVVEIDNQKNIEYESLCGRCYIEKVMKNNVEEIIK